MSAIDTDARGSMESVNELFNPLDELQKKISVGEKLKECLNCVSRIKGAVKLQRKVSQELAFLRKILQQNCVKAVHVKCSNLNHLEAHVNYVLNQYATCSYILETFDYLTPEGTRRLCVDVVKDDGNTWVKVIARNARALTLSSMGDAGYGQRSIIDQAKDFLICAAQHPHHFKSPKITFVFAGGIEEPLAIALEKMEIDVHGTRISHPYSLDQNSDAYYSQNDSEDEILSLDEDVAQLAMEMENQILPQNNTCSDSTWSEKSLNLDITAMIAYVSALTNGGANAQFDEILLNQQAQWEREKPAKAVLDDLFEGKTLYCCKAAVDDFRKIIYTLGGPTEIKRAESLLERITVVPDQLSERTKTCLKEVGKVKARSRIIFGTGDHIKAITVTANKGFVRAAKSQGLTYSVAYHESRALTERKAIDSTNTD